jgi:hypothetical protein
MHVEVRGARLVERRGERVVVSTSSPSAVAMSMAHSSKSLKLRMAPAMLACTCHQRPLRVIRRPSGGHQEAIRRSSEGHREVIREAIRRPSGGHQEVISLYLR